MNKEDLIKLAKVAGLETRVANENLIWIQEDGHDCVPWNPSCDIAQAFEVLDIYEDYILEKHANKTWSVTIWTGLYRVDVEQIEEKCKAICQAVLRAINAAQET